MNKVAVVTGFGGQDSSYLSELLLEKDYKVYGVKRRNSSHTVGCCEHLKDKVEIVEADLTDLPSIQKVCSLAKPHEFYNLAAQSHVGTSFDQPVYTAQSTGLGVLNCLEAIRSSGLHTRFYQASTTELFCGDGTALNEKTPFVPKSPYGVAKLFAHHITRVYRESYRMFCCCGILGNHESPRRGPNFVTRKITLAVADIKAKHQEKLYLGNLDAKRDWGHAKDFVRGMWMMLNHSEPDDFLLATGVNHSVREFCDIAFSHVGLKYTDYVEIDPRFYRANEVPALLGDASKAKEVLGWKPEIAFEELVKQMVDSDMEAAGL